MSFFINSLKITADETIVNKNKSIYKNLSPKIRYFFNDFYENDGAGTERSTNTLHRDFFEKNINIQAIVGKNGSGKSSLMDVLYMMINNLAFFLTKNLDLPAASKIYYIPNLYAKICFSIDSKECTLNCADKKMKLKTEDGESFGFDLEDDNSFCNEEKTKRIAQYFFYTIVSNYSMQSFISSNYNQKVLEKEKVSWINSIFHKNDGYICPIVLNPFRNDGSIDLNREMELSKDRLTSLLIWFKLNGNYNDNSPFAPYSYSHIKIREKENYIEEKFYEYFENKEDREEERFEQFESKMKRILNFIEEELNNNESFLRKILSTYSLKNCKFNKFQKEACAYLLLKTMSISQKYPSYTKFKNVYKIKIEDDTLKNEYDSSLIEEFLNKIQKDDSHITKKIRRTIHFLKINFDGKDSIKYSDKHYNSFFSNEQTLKKNFSSPSEIDEHLPPSIFSYELFLKNMEKGSKEKTIPYSTLSSGEIQMLQTLSVHIYHIENIISVPEENRPKYKNINLVFDEVEICFHPEYQRQFIKRLLTVLNAIIETEKENLSFNIFIITHSPFILSDIPVNHVLFLEDGKPKEKHSETFAGNIGEMLYDLFFLKSTIGAFAEEKIKCLIQKRQGAKTMSEEEAERLLECISDPVIKALIKEIGKGKFDD